MARQCCCVRSNKLGSDKARSCTRLRSVFRQAPEHRSGVLTLKRDSEGLVKPAGFDGSCLARASSQSLGKRLPGLDRSRPPSTSAFHH